MKKNRIWILWREFLISHKRLHKIEIRLRKFIMTVFPSKCDHIDFLFATDKFIICKNCGFIYDKIGDK
jgi:hypothetical protein